MNISPENYKRNSEDILDTESLLAKRKKTSKEDDGTPWLITFADLMTILLVFTFVLFITNTNKSSSENAPENIAPENTSLVTLAHADTAKPLDNEPAPEISNNSPDKKLLPVTRERVILKKHLNFPSKYKELRKNHIIELKKFAKLLKDNQDSKLIVSISKKDNQRLVQNALDIVNHLEKFEGIKKSKIYIQTASPIILPERYNGLSSDRIVELKLIKPFWWF